MTDAQINRANITAFVARAINRASATAVDTEFGLRVREAAVTLTDNVEVDLGDGHLIRISIEHVLPSKPAQYVPAIIGGLPPARLRP